MVAMINVRPKIHNIIRYTPSVFSVGDELRITLYIDAYTITQLL